MLLSKEANMARKPKPLNVTWIPRTEPFTDEDVMRFVRIYDVIFKHDLVAGDQKRDSQPSTPNLALTSEQETKK